MAKIRVVRLLEYTYDDVETALQDRAMWHVQETASFGHLRIRSAVLPANVFDIDAVDLNEPGE